ncbi:MFS transporter [Streptosporangiaceae bacterium NEAU-GS5]|nr:MFS transporter [Streptosporangiaceae bacterium NEAU-GS5]
MRPPYTAPACGGFAWSRSAATLALLSFAMMIVSLDQYIVVVALPDMGRDLGYSAQTLQSVVSAYAVASSGFLLFGGRATDLLGRRRILIAGLTLYSVASLAGGLSTTPPMQLTARAVQGFGGALVFPSTLALVNTTFAEGRARNRALAIWGGAGAAGLVVGVLLGGVLTQAFGWEAVFFVNVPLAGTALVFAFSLIDADPPRDRARTFRSAWCAHRHRCHLVAGVRTRTGPGPGLGLTGDSRRRGGGPAVRHWPVRW